MTEPTRSARWNRLGVWALFTLIFGLLPLTANAIRLGMHDQFSWTKLLQSGELFLVAAVLAAGAVGEVLFAELPERLRFAKIISGFGCVATLAGNALAYASVSADFPDSAVIYSLWFFVPTVLASASGIYLAAGN